MNNKKIDDILNMDNINYSTFVGLINERNRPSGGIKTIHCVAVNALINEKKRMLEIGSTTGFTIVNMSLLTGCQGVGIDINQKSVDESIIYAKKQGVGGRVKFIQGDATKLPFKNEEFDVVWASNVTSFISDKEKAIREYLRVLRPGGTLVVVPIYYTKEVPDDVLRDVSEAIGVKVDRWNKDFWVQLFTNISTIPMQLKVNVELYFERDFEYVDRTDFISEYVNQIIENNITIQSEETKKQIKKRFSYFMELFNENLKYAGFSILLFQKRLEKDETELFLSKPVRDI
ncbi:MAG: methyltransferase domain-containing protein [Candidatus Staskawiczbacteria bacterium]|nr:methyltransferase domain-containing protein [Candidatus Staskawiczbacteria bacterium]